MSLAVNGWPSCHVMPGRMSNVHVIPSEDWVQLVATPGAACRVGLVEVLEEVEVEREDLVLRRFDRLPRVHRGHVVDGALDECPARSAGRWRRGCGRLRARALRPRRACGQQDDDQATERDEESFSDLPHVEPPSVEAFVLVPTYLYGPGTHPGLVDGERLCISIQCCLHPKRHGRKVLPVPQRELVEDGDLERQQAALQNVLYRAGARGVRAGLPPVALEQFADHHPADLFELAGVGELMELDLQGVRQLVHLFEEQDRPVEQRVPRGADQMVEGEEVAADDRTGDLSAGDACGHRGRRGRAGPRPCRHPRTPRSRSPR